ncbi:hypothetical protein BT96DRAFT_618565 [Gymnopus androsaceus JB14]|uniref:Uncharacterized protein n=1 Tax=Gymnopus androsaceus JB14 TaxID=1447944 RepID=A0A6A4HX01_9AGAR|nr:hypothetical protein BT96DRAFT_618565 [Gymnopus androsaceus JB14]
MLTRLALPRGRTGSNSSLTLPIRRGGFARLKFAFAIAIAFVSQMLSSARARKLSSSSHRTASLHPSYNFHYANNVESAFNLSISLPYGLSDFAPPERSALSLEKEIMRLQEVLKKREAEIELGIVKLVLEDFPALSWEVWRLRVRSNQIGMRKR